MEVGSVGPKYTAAMKALGLGSADTFGGFQDILSEAIDAANETDAVATGGAEALLTGDVNNLHQVLIDSEKATLALSLTVQIRNKVIDAYNEVMRMQV